MNIGQAKEYIKDTVRLYLKKDEFDEYRIPVVRQRPVFLIGAPGIGKTAIMEQIAQELGIALVSYSMTHHTRQSALGLPYIEHKEYEGERFDVSEYTMSEIIASVYEVMERSGLKEGILFLDEINCVSETLSPSMLQFLQYKVFGRHRVPEGWVIVTAGNPLEYNRSVREFDVVTLDRLKVLNVEADYETWKKYAHERGIHAAVTGYLELKKADFYLMEMTASGRNYVTARGWEDLSQILLLYEEEGLKVTQELVSQYLRHERIVREFTAYYDLFQKYKKDYRVVEILHGKAQEETIRKASEASFDERISLLSMLTDYLDMQTRENMEKADYLSALLGSLKVVKKTAQESTDYEHVIEVMTTQAEARKKLIHSLEQAGALSSPDKKINQRVIRFLEKRKKDLLTSDVQNAEEAFALIKSAFDKEVADMKQETEEVKAMMHELFVFCEKAYAGGNEMLLLVTHLTMTSCEAAFIARFGSEDYIKHNEEMMLSERQNELLSEIEKLEL